MSTPDDMALPSGKTCIDCKFHGYCVKLFGCDPTNTHCDWAPSRFAAKKVVAKNDQELEGYGFGV